MQLLQKMNRPCSGCSKRADKEKNNLDKDILKKQEADVLSGWNVRFYI